MASNLKRKKAWLKLFVETAPSRLAAIANCAQRFIQTWELIKIAEDRHTDARILSALAMHPAVEVREAVADNCKTPLASLMVLAGDESADLRYQLAENHQLPKQILQVLVEDQNPYVSARAEKTLHQFVNRMMCCVA